MSLLHLDAFAHMHEHTHIFTLTRTDLQLKPDLFVHPLAALRYRQHATAVGAANTLLCLFLAQKEYINPHHGFQH